MCNLLQIKLSKGVLAHHSSILLYGPPKNGKTMLTKAIANKVDCTIFNVTPEAFFKPSVN